MVDKLLISITIGVIIEHRGMMDENTLEFVIGFPLLILLFLGLYAVTRVMAWLDRLLGSRKQ